MELTASTAVSRPAVATTRPGGGVVRLGMSTALSGPAAGLGVAMRDGVQASISEVNRAGGINGRRLELVALDDGYEPARTAPNMRKLIDVEGVLAVVGNVGTPTAVVAAPIAKESHVLFFGAFTGAGALRRDPPDRYVVNVRASYAEETGAMVDALVDRSHLSIAEIGFFTQRDAYGDAGFVGGVAALRRHGLKDETAVPHGRYDRNTTAVENGLADLLQSPVVPKAVIMVGAYAPCASFIKLAKEAGLDAVFLNVSFVGTAPLAEALGPTGDGVIITQVVPHPRSDVPAARAYRAALAAWDPAAKPGFGSFEGYAAMRVLCLALARIDGEPTRESIVTALEGLGTFDVGLGVPLLLDAKNHQASHTVWPTRLQAGASVPIEWASLSRP